MNQRETKSIPPPEGKNPLTHSHLQLIHLLATGDTGRSAHRIVEESGIMSYSTYKRIKDREDFKGELIRQLNQHRVHDRSQAWRSRRRNLLRGDERAIKDTLDRTEGPPAQTHQHSLKGGPLIPIIIAGCEDIRKPPIREDLIKQLREANQPKLQQPGIDSRGRDSKRGGQKS